MSADSSSDDENDMYNSVARFKALRKQIDILPEKDNIEIIESSPEPSVIETRSRRSSRIARSPNTLPTNVTPVTNKRRSGRLRKNKQASSSDTIILDPDIEVPSVTEKKSVSTFGKIQNDVIVLDENSSDNSDVDNYDMDIKILWKSKKIHRFNIHRCENFEKVFKYLAEMDNVSVEQVLITRKKKAINLTDTPASIGLSVIDILEGGIVDPTVVLQGGSVGKEKKIDENVCNVKIQTASKQSLTVPIRMDQQFRTVIISCAKQLDIEESRIKLYFDGEKINSTDTPESLDLEQEACIDLQISAT